MTHYAGAAADLFAEVEMPLVASGMKVIALNVPCSFISFLHNTDIICYFSSLLINPGLFQLTSIASKMVLLVGLMVMKYCGQIVSCSYWQPQGGCFF